MKNIFLVLLTILSVVITVKGDELDTLWYRSTSFVNELDFTPDDRYVIAWTNAIEFWEVQKGVEEFSTPIETVGDYNFNEQFLVFAHDSTPKLLNWQTRNLIEGFEKQEAFLGRIKTAKSKNEFMATKGHHPKLIYFWDINQKKILDSFEITKEFEKDGQRWGRSIHEYDYVGNNDELIYVIMDETNDVLQNIPLSQRKQHYYVNFYSRETKELVDSVYSFTNTNEQFGGFNKMQVMNDRTKIAWCHRGGEINFYDIINKRFYNKIVFDDRDFVEPSDIEFNKNNTIIGVSKSSSCCRYIKIFDLQSQTLLYQYNVGSWNQFNFSNNELYFISSISGFLSLYPKHWVLSNILSNNQGNHNFTLSPNPTTNRLNINLNSNGYEYIRLSIVDLLGNEVGLIEEGLMNTSNYQKEYDVSDLPPSIYFIRLEIGNEVVTKQFIKE